jgi:hypothetical protein
MQCEPMLRFILRDEGLTRGLGDIEARMLIDWLVGWTEILAGASRNEEQAWDRVRGIWRRARGISRFVQLWSNKVSRGSAIQLAASERFSWPLPATGPLEPDELMESILEWESQRIAPEVG